MSANPMFAASLFDSPLVIIIILAASALVNWLTKRRQQAEEQESEPPSPDAQAPRPNWREVLERTLEGRGASEDAVPPVIPPPVPRGRPLPPPMPRPVRLPRVRIEPMEEISLGDFAAAPQPSRTPRTPHVRTSVSQQHGIHPPLPSLPSLRHALRRPESARQAFAASLVFGPPKGLEP